MIAVTLLSPATALRAGLQALLRDDPEIVVVAQAAHWEELETLQAVPQDMQVFIVTPGGVDWKTFPAYPTLALLWIANTLPAEVEFERLDLLAWGVIAPEATAEALQAAVHALAMGLVVVSPEIWQRWGESAEALPEEHAPAPRELSEHLTGRETDVLRLLAQGLTNKQIALALAISEHTVKFHVSSLYSKLGVNNRMEAARKGALVGLIPL